MSTAFLTGPDEMRLYALPISTYCAKLRIVLDYKSIPFDEVPPPEGYKSEAYRALVPTGTIPALQIDDQTFYDSGALVELIEDLHPTPVMRPDSPFDRARMRALNGYHDTRLEPAIRALFPFVQPASERDNERLEVQVSEVVNRIQTLSTLIDPAPLLFGEMLSLVDCAYPTTLIMAQDICGALGYPITLPDNIALWLDELLTIPAVTRSVTMSQAQVQTWLDSKLRR